MRPTNSFPVLTRAIQAAEEQLARLPNSSQVSALRMIIRGVGAEVAEWETRPPLPGQREGITTKVLAIHLALKAFGPRKR